MCRILLVIAAVALARDAHADAKTQKMVTGYQREARSCKIQSDGVTKLRDGATTMQADVNDDELAADIAALRTAQEPITAFCTELAAMIELLNADRNATYKSLEPQIMEHDKKLRDLRKAFKDAADGVTPIIRRLVPRINKYAAAHSGAKNAAPAPAPAPAPDPAPQATTTKPQPEPAKPAAPEPVKPAAPAPPKPAAPAPKPAAPPPKPAAPAPATRPASTASPAPATRPASTASPAPATRPAPAPAPVVKMTEGPTTSLAMRAFSGGTCDDQAKQSAMKAEAFEREPKKRTAGTLAWLPGARWRTSYVSGDRLVQIECVPTKAGGVILTLEGPNPPRADRELLDVAARAIAATAKP